MGLLLLVAAIPLAARGLSPAVTKTIDALFSPYRMPDTPGCALRAYRDGKPVYAGGYGSADPEHAVPIRPNTIFDIGSTSKQFMAASVILLQEETEHLPDYANPRTILICMQHPPVAIGS